MRAAFFLVLLLPSAAFAQPTPEQLWSFQGIEDVNALAFLPDADGDGVADILVETYDAGASGDHLYLLSGGDSGTPAVIWSVRPSSGASDGGGYGQECLVSCDDLGGDGFPDVLLGTAWGNRSVHAVDGLDGTVLWTFDTYDEPASGWIYTVRAHPDRTGDGKPEVVFGAGSDSHRGYLLDGSDGSVIWRFIGASDAIGHTVSLPDMNDDDVADVLFCGWDNEDRVFCVSGAGSIAATQIWARDTGASNHTATVIDDVTGDGIAEVVVGTWQAADQVICLDGSDGSTVWTYNNGSYNYVMRLVAIEDVDDDHYRDLAVGSFGRGLPVISGRDGTRIWESFAGTTNGGDFWTVAAAGDVDGDGLGEVIGGSFDYHVYLFSGADGDTLWTYDTGNRLYSTLGASDLSGNLAPDVIAGTQYLSGGGRAYALEGGDDPTAVPELPLASGRATRAASTVTLAWTLSEALPCVVDRVSDDSTKLATDRLALARAFERGEIDTRTVLAAVHSEKSQRSRRLTDTPLMPVGSDARGIWSYDLEDPAASLGVTYRISAVLSDGREAVLLHLTPRAGTTPRPLLQAATLAPNPFNPRTEIRLTLDRAATASVAIHDARGRRVAALGPRELGAGSSTLRWDGTGFDGRALPTGLYVFRIDAGGESRSLKASLIR